MKTFHWLLPLLAAVLCISCKETKAEFTPYIQVSHFYLNPEYSGDSIIGAQDTLWITTSSDGTYVLDSIEMGDVVVYQAFFGSYANDLVAARVNFDTTQLDMYAKLNQEIQAILLPKSNISTIQLYLNPGFNGLCFPIVYTPLKSGVFDFSMTVESDSQFSPRSVNFRQPVR